ncbi:MAG: hypothetical protein IJT43_03855 [Stomatobaculum sp.]|nr:hypothetical protein [Stomatobaculum sp.]
MKAKEKYKNFDPAKGLKQFCGISETPMIQMEHLRQLDFPITRGISYERTVDEFLLQLETNDALRDLRNHKDMAVLLNEEGAMIREKGLWTLYFTPNRSEHLTLKPEADLYEVMLNLQAKFKKGDVCKIKLPERSLKTLVSGLAPFCILDEFCKNEPGGYLQMAKQIVLDGPAYLFKHVPVCRYGALTTVDLDEIESYHTINGLLDDYIYSCEHTAQNEVVKPLSIAVFGPPGAGKSFGVKQIAKSRGRFTITSINLSQYNDPISLFQAMDQALRCEVGRIPLVFFDEFDAERDGVSRGWLKYFLAPMQDGEYTLDGKLCTIPGAVFVFAGATASSFQEFLPSTKEEETEFQLIKGPDFVSRLKGILNIQGPNPTKITDGRYMVRRALLFRNLIMSAVPGIFDEPGGHANISPGLLSSLLRVSEYRHGSRSIELLIGMSRLTGAKRYTTSCLPIDAQLDIHLDVKDFRAKLAFEQIMGGRTDQYAEIAHKKYQEKRREEAKTLGYTPEQMEQLEAEPEMKDYDELDEFYKEGHRSQIRYLGQRLESFQMDVGLRPIVPGAVDTVTDLYGPVLEQLSELEHERWMRDKQKQGWRYAPAKDPDLKLSPEMVPYEELEPVTKEMIRRYVREVPGYLREMGYEMYRKAFRE